MAVGTVVVIWSHLLVAVVAVLVGLRLNARRIGTLREQLRLANQLHSAYITSAHNEDLAEVGPATGQTPTVQYDQDTDDTQPRWESEVGFRMHVSRGWNEDPFAPDCGCDLAPCGLVVPRAGCVQHDNSKTIRQAHPTDECPAFQPAEVFDFEPDGYCPVEGHHITVGRRDHRDWLTWCSCGWEAESTNQAQANQLQAAHQQQVTQGYQDWADRLAARPGCVREQCPHEDRCADGCRWDVEGEAPYQGPQSLPKVSD